MRLSDRSWVAAGSLAGQAPARSHPAGSHANDTAVIGSADSAAQVSHRQRRGCSVVTHGPTSCRIHHRTRHMMLAVTVVQPYRHEGEIFCITDHFRAMTARFLSVVLRRIRGMRSDARVSTRRWMPTTPRCHAGAPISKVRCVDRRLLACLQRLGSNGAAAADRQLAGQACEEELGRTLRTALANQLSLPVRPAAPHHAEAEDLSERRALTGEPLRS